MARYLKAIEAVVDGSAGNKAARLGRLKSWGFPIPRSYAVTCRCYRDRQSGLEVIPALRGELRRAIAPGRSYAVRSSADVEDTPSSSCAGQFESVLNVSGLEETLQAVERVWESAGGGRAQAYLSRMGRAAGPSMGVIVQEMVQPVLSGVALTRNPVTRADEVVVEALPGQGDALVQEGRTPARWVCREGEVAKPPGLDDWPDEARRLADQVVLEVAGESLRLARRFKAPLDLEWAFRESLCWLQAREITALQSKNVYSSRMAREFLPGCITPLVWSVNVQVVNSSWKRLLVQLIGERAESLEIEDLSRLFYNRAYFNMGVVGDIFQLLGMPRQSVELLLGVEEGRPRLRPGLPVLRRLPNLLHLALECRRTFGEMDRRLADLEWRYRLLDVDPGGLGREESLARVHRLMEMDREAARLNILAPLALGLCSRLLKWAGLELEGLDLSTPASRKIDPAWRMEELRNICSLCSSKSPEDRPEEDRPEIDDSAWLGGGPSGGGELEAAEMAFLRDFGHLSSSGNDFFIPQWRETPGQVHRTILQAAPSSTVRRHAGPAAPGPVLLRPGFRTVQRLSEQRDRVSFLYTYGYSLFRPYFLHLDGLLQEAGLEQAGDIFYLRLDEVEEVVRSGTVDQDLRQRVRERREEMAANREATVPETVYGEHPPPISRAPPSRRLKGLATSRGYHQGPVRVVRGLEDMPRLKEGDVLVVSHSDVGLTPLFVLAGALVSESGGLLSHCSIVAREYGIPAVLSVPGACLIEEGTLVGVDGYRGEVLIMEEACL
ncbi:MAG: hypothetical protein GKC10_02140 [Methanosarcinales archaeon]|nr:hypothetical protein [Methanosarcinales archaeon]